MMTCRNVLHLQDAFLDGELSSSLRAEVHAHLLQCPECQQQFELLRACADVIGHDRAEPPMSEALANRLVQSLPRILAPQPHMPLTRRSRRRALTRAILAVALPAAAAVLLFAVLIAPTMPTSDHRPTLVAGKAVEASGAQQVLAPTVQALNDTTKAAQSLNRLLELSVDQARNDARGRPQGPSRLTGEPGVPSFADILLQPFDELLKPVAPKAPADDQQVVRF